MIGGGAHREVVRGASSRKSDARDIAEAGETVNTAARLTGLAGSGEILVNAQAATAEGLETTGSNDGRLSYAGREQSVDAWVTKA
jgi:class 3 adenylate cyclase